LIAVRNQRSQIRLAPDFSNLPVLERFISGCTFLDAPERNKAILSTTEVFDNIVTHSRCFSSMRILVRIRKNGRVWILLRYFTCNFNQMIRANATTRPHFDRTSDRYRGLGLRMCRNLASSIHFRKGLFTGSIIIIL
jgi:hypothetical protein